MRKTMMMVATVATSGLTAFAALKTPDSFTLDDYVQSGIALWYDGVANAGKTAPHSTTATTWQDLADANHSATLTVNVTGESGAWVANGYALTTGSYFKVTSANAPALGTNFTVQFAVDVALPAAVQFVPLRTSDDLSFAYVWKNAILANWKVEPYAGGTPGSRPNVDNWDGRYWSGAFDETTCSATMGTSFLAANGAVVKARTSIIEVPALEWTFGGRASAGWNMLGTFHALRMYSRKLTDAELLKNRIADEARFHNRLYVTNVVVAATVGGLAGAEAAGAYYLDGTATLTAPDCVQDGGTWEAYGYTLQTWDAANARWGEPVAHTGNSCALDAATISTCVRLAWKWRLKSGLSRLDARAYVQEGLILAYDGVENAPASGTAHDAAATVWADCTGHGYDAEFGGADLSTGGWTNGNAYAVRGSSWVASATAVPFGCGGGSNMTLQIYGAFYTNHLTVTTADVYPNIFNSTHDFSIYNGYYKGGGSIVGAWKTDYYQNNATSTSGRPSLGAAWNLMAVNAAMDETGACITGESSWDGLTKRAWGAVGNPLGWFGFSVGGAKYSTAPEVRYLWADFNAVRLYSRKLTNAELAHNASVDAVRFRGGETTLASSVQVRSARANAVGVESGAYLLEGSYTFTATNLVTAAGSFTPAGCWVETWDATTGVWSGATYHVGASCTLASGAAAQRLTWCWTANALRTAADYTLDDYVPCGFLMWYDGIANAGRDAPHDADATFWQDLAGAAHKAKLTVSDATNPGAWSTKGYDFAAGSYFCIAAANAPALGTTFTIQTVSDVPLPAVTGFNLFRTANDFCCVYDWANGSNANWKNDPYAGSVSSYRPTIYSWKGQYWSGTYYANGCAATEGTSFLAKNGAAVKTSSTLVSVPSLEWTIGGRAAANWNLTGTIYAVRVYSRQLTDAELLQNRKVDEARFHNRLYVTNVVVAAGRDGLFGAEAPGAYEIEGSWTFTAQPQMVGEGANATRYAPSGYVIETLQDGVWTNPVRYTGASCTLSAGDAAVKRLTWRWRSDNGTMIFLR